MGWDAEQAEDQYWEYRAHGLTDAQIIRGVTPDDNEEREEGKIMSNETAKNLRAAIAEAQAMLDKIERRRPIEPTLINVIGFKFQYDGYGRVYDFVATCADGRWYVTGKITQNFTWSGMFDYFEARGTMFEFMNYVPAAMLDFEPTA